MELLSGGKINMPEAPLKQCAKCKLNLTREMYCLKCAELKKKQYQAQRNKSWQHLYGSRWRKARKSFLINHPLCADCLGDGLSVRANVVDHIKPHKGNIKLFWDRSNWQGLCDTCHNKKTANEGAFGRS